MPQLPYPEIPLYKIGVEIGRGAMGRVFSAEQIHTGRRAAVKVIDQERFASYSKVEKNQIAERFRREALAASMIDHENVVIIHDFDVKSDDFTAYMVMELLDGKSLDVVLKDVVKFSVEQALPLIAQICAGVSAAHTKGCVHRDLKPANVVILPTQDSQTFGRVKIIDFGIAKILFDPELTKLTDPGSFLGSPRYASPEQFRAQEVDERSDIYSLGVIFYEMVTGELPFRAESLDQWITCHLHETPSPMPLDIPQELSTLILRCLEKDPEARPASVASIQQELSLLRLTRMTTLPQVLEKTEHKSNLLDPTQSEIASTRTGLLDWIHNALISEDIAIDFGTANTIIYIRGLGIVLAEPSVVTLNTSTNRITAFGRDAKWTLGRLGKDERVIHPMKDGAISDVKIAIKLLRHFLRKAHAGYTILPPRIIFARSSESTQAERVVFSLVAEKLRARSVFFMDQSVAAATGIGACSDERECMVVNIGAGTTEIAVMCGRRVSYTQTLRCGGQEMDQSIVIYLKRKYNLLIGDRTAEAVKIALGSAFPLEEPLSMDVRGRNLIEGIPKTITVIDEEVREALSDAVGSICNAVRNALERIPPELSAEIVEKGIILTGGGAYLKELDRRLTIETGLPVVLANDPLSAVVLGLGNRLSDFRFFERSKKELP